MTIAWQKYPEDKPPLGQLLLVWCLGDAVPQVLTPVVTPAEPGAWNDCFLTATDTVLYFPVGSSFAWVALEKPNHLLDFLPQALGYPELTGGIR